jgi:uncharacterized protein
MEGWQRIYGERFDQARQMQTLSRVARYRTGVVNYHKVVAPPGVPCTMSQPGSYEAFMRATKGSKIWRNDVADESGEKVFEFDPVSLIHLISPTPLLMIPAEHDNILPLDMLVAAYERAGKPKAMSTVACGHFDVYEEPWLTTTAGLAIDWFRKYL